MSSLIKKINRLISKGTYVLYLIFLMDLPSLIKERKTDVLETSISSERKFEETHYFWRAKSYKVYSGKHLF